MYIKQNEYFTSKEDMADIIDSNFQITLDCLYIWCFCILQLS